MLIGVDRGRAPRDGGAFVLGAVAAVLGACVLEGVLDGLLGGGAGVGWGGDGREGWEGRVRTVGGEGGGGVRCGVEVVGGVVFEDAFHLK